MAITMLHDRGIEVSALIHDGLLLPREDAEAINIDDFAAELRERLGFRWLTLKWKPLEVTEDVMAWRDDLLSRHSRVDPPALRVAEHIRSVLEKRTKLAVNPTDIARAILPELRGNCVYSRGYWILSGDGILFLYSSFQAAKMEGLNGTYRDLIEPAVTYLVQEDRNRLADKRAELHDVEKKLQQADENNKESLKDTQGKLEKAIKSLENKVEAKESILDSALSSSKRGEVFEWLAERKSLNDHNHLGWLEAQRASGNVGKVPFRNGVLDMESRTLYDFDSIEHYFFRDEVIPSKCEGATKEEKAAIWRRVMQPCFGEEQARFFCRFVAGALAGCKDWKLFLFVMGFSNSGKGIVTKLIQNTFGPLVGIFNSDRLLAKRRESEDAEKAGSWLHEMRHDRILLANEVKNQGQRLDGTVLKMLASGGDAIKARQNYGFSEEFVLKGLPILFGNDRPEIKPMDSGVSTRMVTLIMPNRFVGEEQLQHDLEQGMQNVFLRDPGLEELVRQSWAHRAFLSILLDHYAREQPQVPDAVLAQTRDDIAAEDPIETVKLVLVPAQGHEAKVEDIQDALRARGSQMNQAALKEALKRYGYNLTTRRPRRADGTRPTTHVVEGYKACAFPASAEEEQRGDASGTEDMLRNEA